MSDYTQNEKSVIRAIIHMLRKGPRTLEFMKKHATAKDLPSMLAVLGDHGLVDCYAQDYESAVAGLKALSESRPVPRARKARYFLTPVGRTLAKMAVP